MKRIFTTLALLSTAGLATAFGYGLAIGDAKAPDSGVDLHFGLAMIALILAALVHAIVLTYFMGTGRWMEETTKAYRLDERWRLGSNSLKYRTVPGMVVCLLLLVATGAFGAAADPASPVEFAGWGSLDAATVHLLVALLTLGLNLTVNFWEYIALDRNGLLVNEVLDEVRRIRLERGLPV